MSSVFLAMALCETVDSGLAATSINVVDRFAHGANIGWMDWRGDVVNGAVVGEFVCAGFIHAANVGWIHLGDGTPANGIRYQNNSSSDFGVNHDGAGNLTGFAYGENIGWLVFTNRDATGVTYDGPKLDLLTGRLSGFVWSANCGWFGLSNDQAHVQTDHQESGPDSDGDGLPDDWERAMAGNLTSLEGSGDNDGDGQRNVEEYHADTNPLDAHSLLRITGVTAAPGGSPVTIEWTSSPRRVYRLRETNEVAGPLPWPEAGIGLLPPSAGSKTLRTVSETASPQRFFVVEAFKPLHR